MTAPQADAQRQRDTLASLFQEGAGLAQRLPLLPAVLERAAAACAENLSDVTMQKPRLSLLGITGGTLAELLEIDAANGVVGVLRAEAWDSRLLVRLDRQLALAYVEMALGGDGSQPPHTPERPLSRIETRVSGTLLARLGSALEVALGAHAPTPFAVEGEAGRVNPDLLGGLKARLAIARFRVEFGDRGGHMEIAIPMPVLTALRPALTARASGDHPPDAGWSRRIHSQINRTSVVLHAILEERTQPLGDILELKVGQIISLDATPRSRIRVECNGEPLLWCEIGRMNGVYTLRVKGFIDAEQEFLDGVLAA